MLDDVDALKLPKSAKPAGAMALLLGVFECLLAVQTWLILTAWWRFPLVLPMLVLGTVAAVAGYRVTRGSGRAALAATVAAAGSAVLGVGWFSFSLLHGLFSLLTVFVVTLSLTTVILSAIVRPALERVDQARSRLREQGMDLGL